MSGQKKNSKVWLVISDVCMTDCVHLQCKLIQEPCALKSLQARVNVSKHAQICAISPIYLFLLTNSVKAFFCSQQNELLTILHNQCTSLHLSLAPSLSLSKLEQQQGTLQCIYLPLSLFLTLSLLCSYHRLPLPLPLCLCSHFSPPSVFSLSTSPVAQGDGGRKADAFLYLPVPAGTHLRTPEEKTTSEQYLCFSACETTWILLDRNFLILQTDFHPGLVCTRHSSNKEIRKHSSWSPALTLH